MVAMMGRVITPELLAAVAASVAAILSGISLWAGGRREETKWRRDAIIDTLVSFLDSSFASPGDVLMRKRRAGALTDEDRTNADQAHTDGISALTRLRVIAGADVVSCAEELHMADDAGSELVLSGQELPTEDEWKRIVARRRELRDRLLEVARKELGLGPAQKIHPGRARSIVM